MEAPIGRHARAKFSYKALYEADLTIRKGEVVEIVEVVVSGQWWKVRRTVDGTTAEGNAPMAYLDLLESDGEHLIASAPPPIPLATRPCVSNDTAPPFQPCSESFVAAATSRTSDATSRAIALNPREEDPEPTYTSLKDRMAALKGRGLAGIAPAGSELSSEPMKAANFAALPSLTAPTPRPEGRQLASSAQGLPAMETMQLSPQHTNSSKAPGPAISKVSNPRPPPRLPARRPSSQAPPLADAAEHGTPPRPPSASVASVGASRKPPPIPSRRPSPPTAASSRPPPPPQRQLGLAPATAMPRAPPRPATPPPLAFTLTVPCPQAVNMTEAELDLGTQWFTRQPLALPEPLLCLPHATLAAGGHFSSGGGPSELNLGILYGDRSRSFVRIEWGAGIPVRAPRITQQQRAPPRPRTVIELQDAAEQYGERVAAWAETREGKVVGRGECWDLADHALKEVSAALVVESGGNPSAGLAEAIGISFGEVVYVNVDGNVNWGPERRIRRGDVLQFVHSTFKGFYSDGSTTTSTAGNPTTGHTAIVIEDWTGRGADPVRVLQANVGGSPLTRSGEFSLGNLVSGEVRAFRPMSIGWSEGPVRPAP